MMLCTLQQYFAGNHMGDSVYVTGTKRTIMGQPQIPLVAGQRRMFEVEEGEDLRRCFSIDVL
jgi:hypothetical protein